MASIPGWAYLVIGVIVAVYSRLVMKHGNSYAMRLFFYVGMVFFAIGVYKSIIPRVSQRGSRAINSSVAICSVCSSKNYYTSNFCHICGTKIRKNIARS